LKQNFKTSNKILNENETSLPDHASEEEINIHNFLDAMGVK
jgi:hypothetical protein